MSRVKMWMAICAVMIMALAVGTTGALASTIDFDSTHEFYLTVLRLSNSTYLAPTSGEITTAFRDYADYDPSEGATAGVGPNAIAPGSASSVSTTQAAGTWLIDRNSTTAYSGPLGGGQFGGTISYDFTASGPDPDVNANGQVGQSNAKLSPGAKTQLLKLVYTAPAAGTYRLNFFDTYSFTSSVDQSGSDYVVNWFDGFSSFHVKITSPQGGSDNFNDLYTKNVGTYDGSSAIAEFDDSNSGLTWSYGPADYLMNAGQTLTLEVYLTSYYDAQTTLIPVPSTVLLLGSGLMGLGLLRRKWSLRK